MRYDVVVRFSETFGPVSREFETPYEIDAPSASEAVAYAKARFDDLARNTGVNELRSLLSIEVRFGPGDGSVRWTLGKDDIEPKPLSYIDPLLPEAPRRSNPRRRRSDP